MIEISYDNVMNGLNKGLNMTCVCPTQCEADKLYRNARALWYVKGMALCKGVERSIEYGPEGFPRLSIRFKCLKNMKEDSWRGFQGVFLIHPEFQPDNLSSQENRMISDLHEHNIRYLEKWRV